MKPDFRTIPTDPGVYQYFDADDTLIYIGKAKNLRNRIRSYWSKGSELTHDKQQMLKEIARVDWIVVNTEKEAILLEAGLIKKHQPKYNIVLRDDKSWTYIVITDEDFPRIITVRGNTKRKGQYFGPYTSAANARQLVKLIHKILPLRTCKRDLSKLPNGRVCMQYHLGNCLGPCEKLIPAVDYLNLIDQAKNLLKGDYKDILKELELDMATAAKNQHFEKAAVYRNKIRALKSLDDKQDVVHPFYIDQDMIGVATAKKKAVVTIMQVRNGQLMDTLNFTVNNSLNLPAREVLAEFLPQLYSPLRRKPKEVSSTTRIDAATKKALEPISVHEPKKGPKKRLAELAQKNAWTYFQKMSKTSPVPDELYKLKDILQLENLPIRIEAYDISNIGKDTAVGAMVVAMNGKLTKAEYRKFIMRTVEAPNDVAMMKEMIDRRQQHDEWPAAQLILLDGGKAQLNTVLKVIKPEWKERLVALAKRDEELFVPGRKDPIRLPKSDPALLLLRKIRDAVHKQAITFSRQRHRKRAAQ